ncbi:hypothetical protein ACFLYR_00255 [Chloroflexota bacterium]
MKTREDFMPDRSPPDSLREMVLDLQLGPDESDLVTYTDMDQLMAKVYQKIESEALQVYHSNEIWALRQWCLNNILRDEVVTEATVQIADGLINPILEWQKEQPFDSLAHYQHRLTHTLRRRPDTVRAYMITAARFVGKFRRKAHYSDDEVLEYLDWAGEHFTNQMSYVCECQRLLQFLRNLPGENRNRQLPIPMPQMPDKFNQPMWSDEEIEKIAWDCVLRKIRPDMVVRIVVASIFGGRIGELSQLSSEDIYLNGDNSYIYISTLKHGVKKRQPIPRALVPIFSVLIHPVAGPTLHNRLKRVVEKAGVSWRPRSGFHSFRRNVVTMLDKAGGQSDIAIHKFMRWSTPRHLGMLDRYRQTPTEESDAKILNSHPWVKLWQEIIPYLLEFNPYYKSASHIDILT